VRDFIHVLDLADAHTRAVEYLLMNGSSLALNLGTEQDPTVEELLETVERVSGRPLCVKYGPRREGDSPVLVADNALARETLGWTPRHDLDSIIATAWNWHSRSTSV
jgi:UDP-glucose 4-epimerase